MYQAPCLAPGPQWWTYRHGLFPLVDAESGSELSLVSLGQHQSSGRGPAGPEKKRSLWEPKLNLSSFTGQRLTRHPQQPSPRGTSGSQDRGQTFVQFPGVSVFSGCCIKNTHQLGDLKNNFSQFWKLGRLGSICWQIWCLVRACFLNHGQLFSCCVLT